MRFPVHWLSVAHTLSGTYGLAIQCFTPTDAEGLGVAGHMVLTPTNQFLVKGASDMVTDHYQTPAN
jgi:hypothetical protein